MRGCGIWFVGIALDPDQFGRTAADIEQDGAAPLRIEQRRATDHRQRRFGFAIDDLEPDAGRGGDPIPKTVGVRRRAAGFGRNQSQPFGSPQFDLVAANAERRDGALDRGLADAAGCGDPFAEPDDAREGIDHAEAVAGRTGDQEAAIIGAEIQRRIDAASRSMPMACCRRGASWTAARPLAVVSARPRAVAKRRVIVHSNCLSAAVAGRRIIALHGNFSSEAGPRNKPSHRTMPNQALSSPDPCVI